MSSIPKENKNNEKITIIELELGDIIQIIDINNEKLNNQTFFIDYIDASKIVLINEDTLDITILKLNEDGTIFGTSITKIYLLSRNELKGYALQNDLLPNKWVDIFFGGNVPISLTGEITNLEQDMIEIKTYPDNDIIYINFDYKGIPEDIPITSILIREKPSQELDISSLKEEELPASVINFPLREKKEIINNQVREVILKGNQIQFGEEEFGPIVRYADVDVSKQRYSIEVQTNDLLDDLLSTVPNSKRTDKVLNNIHIMIERFIQLRNKFSVFNEYGTVEGPNLNQSDYKPLTDYFKNLNTNLYWILPIVKNIKKVYDVLDNTDDYNDIKLINFEEDIKQISNIFKSYKITKEDNKYSSLYKDLNPYFTPFENLNEENINDIIYERHVEENLNTVVDNLNDLYSSIVTNNTVKTRRFVIQKYNLGLNKLIAKDLNGSRMISQKIKLTEPDTISIKSFVTLPEPTIRFSRISLPGTSILDRSNLNTIFLNYWELLKKNTNVDDIIVNTIGQTIELNENNYVNNIKNYVLNISKEESMGLSKDKIYMSFINSIVPKTKIIFNLMKKYITGKVSIVDVTQFLEPFLVYGDNLTYMQYVEITNFIDKKIAEYNKSYVEKSKNFLLLKRTRKVGVLLNQAFTIISTLEKSTEKEEVLQAYDITYPLNQPNIYSAENTRNNDLIYSNSELLRKIIVTDYGKLYNNALSLVNLPLMLSNDLEDILDIENKNIGENIKNNISKDCNNVVISKIYTSKDQLMIDNNKDIYFDKKYDKTNYGYIDDYEKEMINMSTNDFTIFLINKIKIKFNVNDTDAEYMIDTLINGIKKVIDGQYAILYESTDLEKEHFIYYVRSNNVWVMDKNINDIDVSTDNSSILCDLQKKCITKDDNCQSLQKTELEIQNNLMENIINEFDDKYSISKINFERNIKEKYDYYMKIIYVLFRIQNNIKLKYNDEKYKLGILIDDEDNKPIIVSPYTKLINMILGQSDFVKKQKDIVRFVVSFTRKALLGENEHWLYCLKTNVELLPLFKYKLASAYLNSPNTYNEYIKTVIDEIGKLSDDGDMWCDEHTGYPIQLLEFDTDEGYNDGFKISTRSIAEADVVLNTISVAMTPEIKMFNNIVNAISVSMGINIENQKQFIFNCVTETTKSTLPLESVYKKLIVDMSNKGKTIPSYNDLYNTTVLYNTLGMFLIAVQTSVPSVKSRKTFPGCVRSFNGYPFEGSGDMDSVNYIACIAYKIRTSIEPWNVLKKTKEENIAIKIKSALEGDGKTTGLLSLNDVKRKINEKVEYLLINVDNDEIPYEHDVTNWSQFLPPLLPFKIKNLLDISTEFKTNLLNDLKNASVNQRNKLLVIESKIIIFSLALQEKIANIIKKKNLLLHKNNNEPYLENSCCNEKGDYSTIKYFENEDSSITEYNNIVNKLTNIMEDVLHYSEAHLLFSTINTKNIYPSINSEFNEETIYMTFIKFCNFNSLLPINIDILPLCTDKPIININSSLSETIKKLKSDGRNYSKESFLRLLQIIAKHNIVETNIDRQNVSSITKLIGVLKSIDDEDDNTVDRSLRDLIEKAVDTFDVASDTITNETKSLNNFLIKNNTSMKNEITDFIYKNKSSKISGLALRHMGTFMENLSIWADDKNDEKKISNDNMYNIINFLKTFIENIVTVFPNIILNEVDYKNVRIPDYWKLSSKHTNDLKKDINQHYERLRPFYDNPILLQLLQTIQISSKNLSLLSKNTPCFSSIYLKDTNIKLLPVIEERTSRYLYEYYLLRVFINYIELTEQDMFSSIQEKENTINIEDIITTGYIEDVERRVIFETQPSYESTLIKGNKKQLKSSVADLFLVFMDIMDGHKKIIDISYEQVLDRVFKLKEKEKDRITDRLKNLTTDEERDTDTILKINKLGVWNKGLQKGLTTYDKDFYDDEREFMESMLQYERTLGAKGVSMDEFEANRDEIMDDIEREKEIDKEAYDMSYMTDDYENGDFEGDEEENYDDYN